MGLGDEILAKAHEEVDELFNRKYNELFKEFEKIKTKNMKSIIDEIIDGFYDDYDPVRYKRLGNRETHEGGLYEGYRIFINDDGSHDVYCKKNYLIGHNDYSRKTTDHEADKVVFFNSFINGWHGGAVDDGSKSGYSTGGRHLWKNPLSNPRYSDYLYEHDRYSGKKNEAPKYNVNLKEAIENIAIKYDDTKDAIEAFNKILKTEYRAIIRKYK